MLKSENKLDWSFEVKTSDSDAVETDKIGVKKIATLLDLVGAKEVKEIVFKDSQEKVVGNFTFMSFFKDGTQTTETIKHIKSQMKLNGNIAIIQIIA